MGGGSKTAVFDEDAVKKRKRVLKNNPIGFTLAKKSINSKKERNRLKNQTTFGIGGNEYLDGDSKFSVEQLIQNNSAVSTIEFTNLDDYISRSLARPEVERSKMVLRGNELKEAMRKEQSATKRIDDLFGDEKTSILNSDKKKFEHDVDEYNSVTIPKRPFGLSNSDQVIIERALKSGRAYLRSSSNKVDGALSTGSKEFAESCDYCTCQKYLDCSSGKVHSVELDDRIPNSLSDPSKFLQYSDVIKSSNNPDISPGSQGLFDIEGSILPWECDTNFLKSQEALQFLDWRQKLTEIERVFGNSITPYEKNLQYWRQLWRVVEQSNLILEILDARDPLFFRSSHLLKYISNNDPLKKHLIILNKADFLTSNVRRKWYDFFKSIGVRVIFFSALRALIQAGQCELKERDDIKGVSDDTDSNNDGKNQSSVESDYNFDTSSRENSIDDDGYISLGSQTNTKPVLKIDSALGPGVNSDGDDPDIRILNPSEMRTLLCDIRVEHLDLLKLRRDAVSAILQQNPDWSWWSNGIASELYNKITEENERIQEEREQIQSMKTKKVDPLWLADIKVRQAMLKNKMDRKNAKKNDTAMAPKLIPIQYSVGTIGFPNVGKSSFINSLLCNGTSKKLVGVSGTPGYTKHFQTVLVPVSITENPHSLMHPDYNVDLKFIDCPGLVMPSICNRTKLVLNGTVKIGQLKGNRLEEISEVFKSCSMQISRNYGVPLSKHYFKDHPTKFGHYSDEIDPEKYLAAIALKFKYNLSHGSGVGDSIRVANQILKDYVKGKYIHTVYPPTQSDSLFA